MTEYVLTIVFSHWTLSKILNFLADYLDIEVNQIGPCKIERYRDKRTGVFKDSNRTLVLLKKEIYDKAVKLGLNYSQPQYDFRIEEYRHNFEKEQPYNGYTSELFLVVPKQVSSIDIETALRNKLLEFAKYGFLKSSDWMLQLPLSSRLSGETKGFAMLHFDRHVDISTRIIVKLLLHDSFIYLPYQEKLYHLPVFWMKSSFVKI